MQQNNGQHGDFDWAKECTRVEANLSKCLACMEQVAVKLIQGQQHEALKLLIDGMVDGKRGI